MTSYFVTGTDTGVGKTFCSILLAKKYNAQYYKPIQAGLEETDSEEVKKHGISVIPSTYSLKTPASPHYAAKVDNIDIDIVKITNKFDKPTIVEGAGGVMVPISNDKFMLDVIKYFDLPTIIIARGSVGTINHTLLTIKALRDANVNVEGVIINGDIAFDNAEAIKFYGQIKIIPFPV